MGWAKAGSSSAVAAAPRSGGSFFYSSERFSQFLRITSQDLIKGWEVLGSRQSGSSGCCPASSGQQLFKNRTVKIDRAIDTARDEATVIQTMSDVPASENKEHPTHKQDLAIKKVAVVQCEGFRCLAYRDGDLWRDFQTGKELPAVLSVVFEFGV
jgi:hypothetical protein